MRFYQGSFTLNLFSILQYPRCTAAIKVHRTVSSKCLDQIRKFLRRPPPQEEKKWPPLAERPFWGSLGRLEERNPQVKTTPQLLSPRVPPHSTAFDWPLFDLVMIDNSEIPRPESPLSRSLAHNQALRSAYRSLWGVCRIKSGLRPPGRHSRMVIFVTPVAAYVTSKRFPHV